MYINNMHIDYVYIKNIHIDAWWVQAVVPPPYVAEMSVAHKEEGLFYRFLAVFSEVRQPSKHEQLFGALGARTKTPLPTPLTQPANPTRCVEARAALWRPRCVRTRSRPPPPLRSCRVEGWVK